MNEILAFLKDYYYLIVLVLVLIILILEIVISRINLKNPSILSAIDKILPDVIVAAEGKFPDGASKLNYVVLTIEEYISSLFVVKNVKSYEKYIISSVEKILSCPQKKGD